MEKAKDFLGQSYINRQQVIFVDDFIYDAKTKAEQKQEADNSNNLYQMLYDVLFPTRILNTGFELILKSYHEARTKGLRLNMVPKMWISQFDLPPGHPRDGVLYIAHPVIATLYVPAADFHRFTFEHKFSEALSLLMHLGARHLRVEHIRGWGHEFAADLSAGIPEADFRVGFDKKSTESRHLLYEAEFDGVKDPKLPEKLNWYHYEPTWQSIAEGKLDFGLKKCSLTLQYQDDYGVNAGLKLKAEKAGFDLGGDFQNHESTTWSLNGTF